MSHLRCGLNIRSSIIDTSYIYIGLVLGCIDADLFKYMLIFQHFFEIYKMRILLHRSSLRITSALNHTSTALGFLIY